MYLWKKSDLMMMSNDDQMTIRVTMSSDDQSEDQSEDDE